MCLGIHSAIMLTDHLCDAGGTLPALDFNADIVRNAQGVGWHILGLHDAYAGSKAGARGDREVLEHPHRALSS